MTKQEFRKSIFSLSDRLYPMIMRFLGNQSDAKDAIQDIMVKLWNKRAQLSKHPNVSGFVFLTARNHCLDVLKRKKLTVVELTDNNYKVTDADHCDHRYIELKEMIEEILASFPLLQKEILILRDIDGLEYKEIAEIKDLTVEHVRVLVSRTRKRVQQELIKHHNYG